MAAAFGFDNTNRRRPITIASRSGVDALAIHERVGEAFARALTATRVGNAVVGNWAVEQGSKVSPRLRFVNSAGASTCDRLARSALYEPSIWEAPAVLAPTSTPGPLKTTSQLATDLEAFYKAEANGCF
jgi:hypothetical protein